MLQEATSAGTLTNPKKLYDVLDVATRSVTVDPGLGSLTELASLARLVRSIGLDNISFVTVPTTEYPPDPNRLAWSTQATQLWRAVRKDRPVTTEPSSTPTGTPSGSPSGSPTATASPSGVVVARSRRRRAGPCTSPASRRAAPTAMSAAEPPHRYRSFVALGDSFTEGLQDDLGPAGRHRGWADRVAAALAVTGDAGVGIRYANLAVRGRLLDDIVREQVPVAEALAPDLVSFQGAGNDLLRPRVHVAGVLARYEQAVERLRDTRAEVLLFTVVGRTGGSGRTADLLAARFGVFNAHVRDVAARLGCAVADLGGAGALQDRRFWHEDRLHLGPTGHERVAAAACEALGLTGDAFPGPWGAGRCPQLGGPPGWWRDPLPVRPPAGRRADLVDDVRWVRRHFLPWVSRRLRGVSSGDGLSPETSRARRRAAADT